MKLILYALMALLLEIPTFVKAQSSLQDTAILKSHYQTARQEIVSMLEQKQPLNYEKAIFLIENAWWDNQMLYASFQEIISRDTALIRSIASQTGIKPEGATSPDFQQALRQYNNADQRLEENALMNAAIFSYLTDTLYFVDSGSIYRHLPFIYPKHDPMGSDNWSNTQVMHLLGRGTGNCFALTSLFKIFSERFSSKAIICTAPGHVYITHKDNKGVQYNVEVATRAFPGVGTLSVLTHSTQEAIENDISLRELDLKQSIALCLVYLAKGYEHKFKLAVDDGFMMDCAGLALKYDSLNLNAWLLKAEILEQQLIASGKPLQQLQSDRTFKAYEQLITHLFLLGYREMPLDMKNMLVKGWDQDTVAQLAGANYLSVGKSQGGPSQTRYASLSWGLFHEQIETKPIERYGRTIYNTHQKKIAGFAVEENIYNNYTFDPVVFAWNIDPMAHKYPHASPYNFVENNPLSRIDPDGADWILATGNKIYWYGGKVGDTKVKLATFKSTSGFKGADANGHFFDLQYAKYQDVKSGGPTPAGKYHINLQPSPDRHPKAIKDAAGYALTPTREGGIESVGIMWVDEEQTIARDFRGSWGNFRARLEPEKGTNTLGRTDFYFHDSQKGYSSGCHECETGLFDKLQEYRKNNPEEKDIKVIVQYSGPEQSTNGGTEKKKPAKESTASH
jgi:hypothetical protein